MVDTIVGTGVKAGDFSSSKIEEQVMQDHWNQVAELDGKYITISDRDNDELLDIIPRGLAVNGGLDEDIKDRIKRKTIPFRWGVDSSSRYWQSIVRLYEKAKRNLGINEIMYVAVHTKYEEDKWLSGFIATKDLLVDDPDILTYERDEAPNETVYLSKHLAYLALTEEM
jgi:hypothetical protein